MSGTKKVVVFYHAPCLDGAAAAWSAYKKWGDSAQYIRINHDSLETEKKLILDNVDQNTHAVFADYAPPRQLMDEIVAHTKSVAIYDHHTTAIGALKNYHRKNVTLALDEGRSGGAIVYDELFGSARDRPQAVELAQMIDLERTNLREFFSIAAYLDSLPLGDMQEICTNF